MAGPPVGRPPPAVGRDSTADYACRRSDRCVRGRTGQSVYKRSPPLNLARRPEADALPAGQPSLDVAPPAIGSPSVPSPFVGAATRATGPARGDVVT